jgi:hypothetical protein
MSTSAQIIWLFALVEPADPLTIPPPPLSKEMRQKHDLAAVPATTRVVGRQVHVHSWEPLSTEKDCARLENA